MKKVKIKQATKQGYIECPQGGVFSIAFPKSELRRGRVIDNGQTSPTLDTGCKVGVIEDIDIEKINIRRLMPIECWRLQGFSDDMFKKAAQFNSDSQLYKQAGNSVTVNVIEKIAERL